MGINEQRDETGNVGAIVACSENGVIGRDGGLPWHLPDDLKHFMRTTKGHAVVMGRKTFDSLGKPLGGRLNIVVSRSMDKSEEIDHGVDGSVLVVRSIEEGIEAGKRAGLGIVWIAGGGEIYRSAIDLVDVVVLTRVECEVEGDVYFERLDPKVWKFEIVERHDADDRHAFGYQIERWTRVE